MIVLIQFAGSIKSDIREIGVRFGELLGYKLGYRPDNLTSQYTLVFVHPARLIFQVA